MVSEHEDGPVTVGSPDPLTGRERRLVAGAAMAPVLLAVVVLAPVAAVTGAGVGEVAGAALVYGGLLGLAAAFVAVDRLQARQCPACRRRPARGEAECDCGYDLRRRPRYTCEERHDVYLDAGVCACGRTLRALPTARGVASQVVVALRISGWLLAFLVVAGVALHLLEGRL
jgi:hypothetical protein